MGDMPKLLSIAPHLSSEDLETRYRRAREPKERTHFQILWLFSKGARTEDVAIATGYCHDWIRQLVRRYNREGPAAMVFRPHRIPGKQPLLSAEGLRDLQQVLEGAAPDGGLWTGPKAAVWISERIGRQINPKIGWAYLKKAGFTRKVPRPRHQEADSAAQEAFKKNSLKPSKP